MSKIADLLCIDHNDLATILISSVVVTSSRNLKKNLNYIFKIDFSLEGSQMWPRSLIETLSMRDNLAKTLYGRLFGWIIKNINLKLDLEDSK